MAHIFITGGAGFIGSHTVDRALADGHSVTVYDIKTWEEAENLHHLEGLITYVSGDILDYELLTKSLAGHTHALHLAAIVSVQETIANPRSSHEVNVTGTLNVFEATRSQGVERVVYASSAAVYGASDAVISEATVCSPLSPYGLHKYMNDEYAVLYTKLYGQSLLGLRYFNVYGTRQKADSPYSGVISLFTTRARAGEGVCIYGDGSASRDFVSVSDVARANFLALMSSATGVCNIGSGQETTLNQLVESLEEVVGRPIKREYKESRMGDIVRSVTTTDCAKSLIGFQATVSLMDGLKELVRI
ncbi:MAG: hypothetical protein RL538_862 [Candidatus Parcubacteria bacterium]|jgi:UDP-glucose 4-epimerase